MGAALLSAEPEHLGWWRPPEPGHPGGIDPLRIDMTYTQGNSILGLLFDTYHVGLETLRVPAEDAWRYGFAAVDDADAVALRDAWLLWITARRAGTRPPQPAQEGNRP